MLDEDLAVLEAYDAMSVPIDLQVEVHVRADRLAVAYRRLLAAMIQGEAGDSPDSPASPGAVPVAGDAGPHDLTPPSRGCQAPPSAQCAVTTGPLSPDALGNPRPSWRTTSKSSWTMTARNRWGGSPTSR